MDMINVFLLYVRGFIAAIGVMVILLGAVRSFYQLIGYLIYERFNLNYVRLQFGDCVILGLEFIVGADIVGSLIDPDYYTIGLLGLLVIIRTVLSYFLNLELQTIKASMK